ncbi:MAG: hypothetical protein CML04_07010 [Pseudozobellia sp.]|nr:hypothetical protein [Pseudozobellia sp.]MBG50096.1 hypothetical protein [Pseudozobellia sp.]
MKLSSLETLLVKFMGNSANGNDLDELNEYLGQDDYKGFIKNYLRAHFVVLYKMNQPDLEQTKKELLKEIRRDKRLTLKRNLYQGLKYAAILVCFVAVGIYMFTRQENELSPQIPATENVITLEHSNGQVEEISESGNLSIKSKSGEVIAQQSGNKISFNSQAASNEKVEYSTITVPYGKNITLALSDSTEVIMNAGSRMTFPNRFRKGYKRKVKLSGEAFFKVAHDEKHPFIVGLDSLDVQVLGTAFNVANYTEDATTEVVLVNGSVELVPTTERAAKVLLKPGFKGTFYKNSSRIETAEVPTDLYTSWVNGYVVFRNAPFKNILQKLERHYNVTINNPDGHLVDEKFNATIDVQHETISEVLDYFSKIHNIKFQVNDDQITILKK